ncbi:MAG: hypothetical protein Q7S34_01350 [bacterium]|nr:hypothetical protein [bacterium]
MKLMSDIAGWIFLVCLVLSVPAGVLAWNYALYYQPVQLVVHK